VNGELRVGVFRIGDLDVAEWRVADDEIE